MTRHVLAAVVLATCAAVPAAAGPVACTRVRIPATGTERLNCVGPDRPGPVQCWAVWQPYPPPLPPQEMASILVCVTVV